MRHKCHSTRQWWSVFAHVRAHCVFLIALHMWRSRLPPLRHLLRLSSSYDGFMHNLTFSFFSSHTLAQAPFFLKQPLLQRTNPLKQTAACINISSFSSTQCWNGKNNKSERNKDSWRKTERSRGMQREGGRDRQSTSTGRKCGVML